MCAAVQARLLNRREFLGRAGAVLAGLSVVGASSCRSGKVNVPTKPNVLFILTDDEHPGQVEHMQRLKSHVIDQGTRFTNTVCTYPLCAPSRATLLRGQYAHNTGQHGNDAPYGGFPVWKQKGHDEDNLAVWLKQAGYRTALFGKFINNYEEKDTIEPGWDRWYAFNGPKEGATSVNDQGNTTPLHGPRADDLVRDRALEFLRSTPKDTPFFAWVGFSSPHTPYHYQGKYDNKFSGEGVPRTPAFNEADVSDKLSYVKNASPLSQGEIDKLDTNWRKALRALLTVDKFVGQALASLKDRGMLENTYVVFYTDNGTHWGEHRLRSHKSTPYETDISFDLIVRGPGVPQGATSSRLVGTHDFAPTVAGLAGATVPSYVDGRSIVSLEDQNAKWSRRWILSEHLKGGKEGNEAAIPEWRAVRGQDGKYVRYATGEEEWYDLKKDPYELNNDPSAAPQAYKDALVRLESCSGDSCKTAENGL